MLAQRPSVLPLIAAAIGLALAVVGAFLPWVFLYGNDSHDVNGFGGGWVIAHARGHFSDDQRDYPMVAFEYGADAWTVLMFAALALFIAITNRRRLDQRLDKAQFVFGLVIVGLTAYNWLLNNLHADDHLVQASHDGESKDYVGPGLWLTLLAGVVTGGGALLGNTPEFPVVESDFVPDRYEPM
jgi:hypothetical protein